MALLEAHLALAVHQDHHIPQQDQVVHPLEGVHRIHHQLHPQFHHRLEHPQHQVPRHHQFQPVLEVHRALVQELPHNGSRDLLRLDPEASLIV